MALRAVIFDFDGVLVNSEPLHFRALRESLLPEGIAIEEDEYAREYLAYDDWRAVRIALENHGRPCDPPHVGVLAERKAVIFDRMLADIAFFPGVPELLRTLAVEFPLAIASGAQRGEIEAVLVARGIRDLFAAVVGADDVAQGKPHPEPYLAAMNRLVPRAPGLLPQECLAVEDSMPGVASALAAGMKVVAVTNSYPAGKLSAAHAVVGSLADVEPPGLRALFA
jgi:beta-phosphoglucomutase-like phosphatase (HAD superfamily)